MVPLRSQQQTLGQPYPYGRVVPCGDGSELARTFFTSRTLVGAAMCSACGSRRLAILPFAEVGGFAPEAALGSEDGLIEILAFGKGRCEPSQPLQTNILSSALRL
jgi:hypothetical protein